MNGAPETQNMQPIFIVDGGCIAPPAVDHAAGIFDPVSRKVTYECLPGYRFISGQRRHIQYCEDDGSWKWNEFIKCLSKITIFL